MSAIGGALPRLERTGRVTQLRVLRSEWTKLVSVRSTRWSLLAAVLLTIGLPMLFAGVTSSHWGSMSPHDRADRHPLDIALAGVNVSQLAIAVLGVLTITAEYSTGMIRSTMIAVPKKVAVAASAERDSIAVPLRPLPEVQPPDSFAPKPISTPASSRINPADSRTTKAIVATTTPPALTPPRPRVVCRRVV